MKERREADRNTQVDSSRRKLALALLGGVAGTALLEACGAGASSVDALGENTDINVLAQALSIGIVAFDTCVDLNTNPGPADAAQIAIVAGRSTPRDGGGGAFYWERTSPLPTADNGIVFGTAMSGRWIRIYEGPINVKWFGANGADNLDDTDAIEAAIDAASRPASDQPNGGKCVFFPRGRYRVRRAVFSRSTAGNYGPISYRGEGLRASVIVLAPETGAETWLYDSSTAGAYYFSSFEDLGFGCVGTNASGFRVHSTAGHDQGFAFTRCYFGVEGSLQRGFLFSGSSLTDKFVWTGCFFSNISDAVITLSNNQCVGHTWHGCHFEFNAGDIFKVDDGTDYPNGGGGDFNVFGGSFVYGSEDPQKWLLTLKGGTTPEPEEAGNLDHVFNFYGIRTENVSGAGLVHKVGILGRATVNFYGSQFARNFPPSTFDAVNIDCQCTVRFRDCHIPDSMTYVLNTIASQKYEMSDPGSILFEGCGVPSDLSGRISIEQAYGFARAVGCRSITDGSAFSLEAVDFDLNWTRMASMGRAVPPKTAVLKHFDAWWPRGPGGNLPSTDFESTTLLPAYAVITGFTIFKPAIGTSNVSYSLCVGPNDKSDTWAESSPQTPSAPMSDAHTINVDFAPGDWIHVGTNMNLRRVRLWADPGGDATAMASVPGEIALIHYL